MERVDLNYAIFTLCQGDIAIWIWRTLFHPAIDAHSGPSQASKMNLSVRRVGGLGLKLRTIFAKGNVADVWEGPEYTSIRPNSDN